MSSLQDILSVGKERKEEAFFIVQKEHEGVKRREYSTFHH
jgi:hypothetical protein